MRLPPAILTHTEDVLRDILRFTGPADGVLSRYFRAHPRLGGRDRGASAEAVYELLRNEAVYTHFAESGHGPMMRRLAVLAVAASAGVESVGGLSPEEAGWVQRVLEIDRSQLAARLRANLPPWLFDRLVARHGEAETLALAQGLNAPA